MTDVPRCRHGYRFDALRCHEGCDLAHLKPQRTRHARVEPYQKPEFTIRRDPNRKWNFVDLTGQTLGSWTVLAPSTGKSHGAWFLARHSCGGEHVVLGSDLRCKPMKTCPSCRKKKEQNYVGGRIGEAAE
jgi:hypothetical protein